MSSQGGRIFHQKKTVGPSVFSGLSEEHFEASNVEVQGQEPTPESTGEVGMFRICCWSFLKMNIWTISEGKTVYYLNISGVALFCCVSVFCFTFFFSMGFVLMFYFARRNILFLFLGKDSHQEEMKLEIAIENLRTCWKTRYRVMMFVQIFNCSGYEKLQFKFWN